jgi:hypothetical protein
MSDRDFERLRELAPSFASRIEECESGCWEWVGAKTSQGYGSLRFNGKSVKAHRLSYSLINGEIPDGRMICHHCDNPSCVRPSHLYAGTAADNVRDCYVRGRNANNLPKLQAARPLQVGERHPQSKLTAEIASQMRGMRAKGEAFSRIADQFNVSRPAARDAIQGITWKCVDTPPVIDNHRATDIRTLRKNHGH